MPTKRGSSSAIAGSPRWPNAARCAIAGGDLVRGTGDRDRDHRRRRGAAVEPQDALGDAAGRHDRGHRSAGRQPGRARRRASSTRSWPADPARRRSAARPFARPIRASPKGAGSAASRNVRAMMDTLRRALDRPGAAGARVGRRGGRSLSCRLLRAPRRSRPGSEPTRNAGRSTAAKTSSCWSRSRRARSATSRAASRRASAANYGGSAMQATNRVCAWPTERRLQTQAGTICAGFKPRRSASRASSAGNSHTRARYGASRGRRCGRIANSAASAAWSCSSRG